MDEMPVEVEGLIPHGKSIRVVDRLLEVCPDTHRSEYVVSGESLFVDESGRLEEVAYVEMIAQSAAASRGFKMTEEERREHVGMLLGVREMKIVGEARVGDRLVVAVKVIARFGDFGVVEGEVRHADGRLIATGELKLWESSKGAVMEGKE